MRRFTLLFVTAILVCIGIHAQENPKISKGEILGNKPTNSESILKDFNTAEKYYKKGVGTYDEALKYYLRLYEQNNNIDELNYKIAACYLWSSNKKAALPYLLQAKPETAKDYYYLLGKAYQYNYNYTEAREAYEKHFEQLNNWNRKDKLKQLMQLKRECNFGQQAIKDSTPVFIYNLGQVVNSYYDEYGAIYLPKDTTLIYTSRSPKNEPSKRVSRYKFDEQVLFTENSISTDAVMNHQLKGTKSSINYAVAGYNSKQKRLYFYKGKKRTGDIYSALIVNGKAKKIKSLNGKVNHIAYKETTIAVDENGTGYFVSNRTRGGQGGKDIWQCKLKGKNRYTKVKNLGNVINTPFDEECVYITEDGNTLFFSSNGHEGMGGFDVFKCEKTASGTWDKPVNLGHPINTPADELFYRPTDNKDIALYAAIRAGGYGGLDIYKIVNDNRIPFNLSGYATDIKTGDTLDISVNVFNQDSAQLITSAVSDSLLKTFSIDFEDIGNYSIQVNAEGYKTITDSISCPNERHAQVEQYFQLEKLKFPFTISGYVRDSATYEPLQASILCFDAEQDTLLAQITTNEFNGKYSVTLADKYKIRLEVTSPDYFTCTDSLNALLSSASAIKKTFDLVSSKKTYNLSGNVKSEEGESIINASLILYNVSDAEIAIGVKSDSTGQYNIDTDHYGPFTIEVKAEGYFFVNDTIIYENEDSLKLMKDYTLKKMKSGAKIVVSNILFNSGKSSFKPESYSELDKLADLLIENKDIRIEVSGHTDNVGSASINKKLSKARALAVMNYLINKGIEAERLEYEGYGFDQPIALNNTPEGRAENRRVEIKVIE